MTKINWDADRRRRMVSPQKREAAGKFMDWIIKARTGPVTPKPVKRKRRRVAAKTSWPRKPKVREQHRTKPPPASKKVLVDKRETMFEQRRAAARAARAAGIVEYPVRARQAQSFAVEYRPIKPSR